MSYEPGTWEHEFLPRVLPPGWRIVEVGGDGARYQTHDGIRVIASGRVYDDGKRWWHVSLSRPNRLPSWDEMKRIKDVFIGTHRTAIQVLPPASKFVNIHPFCLHLWCCIDGDPVPDFTCGGGTI